jgi:hypothetical protein
MAVITGRAHDAWQPVRDYVLAADRLDAAEERAAATGALRRQKQYAAEQEAFHQHQLAEAARLEAKAAGRETAQLAGWYLEATGQA